MSENPDEIVNMTVRIPYHLWYAASVAKIDTKESINALIVRLLEQHFAEQGKK